MLPSLCRTSNSRIFKGLLLLIFLLVTEVSISQTQAYEKLPLKRLEFADGSFQCGYYDEVNKKLIGCKGQVLREQVVYVRMYSGDYCCSVEANEGRLGEGIEFVVGTIKLTDKAEDRLDYIVRKLHEAPAAKIRIEVYTDNIGSAESNLILSNKRANVIKEYFVKKGIIPQRLAAAGYGEERPIADNKTEAGRAKNRRVEIEWEY